MMESYLLARSCGIAARRLSALLLLAPAALGAQSAAPVQAAARANDGDYAIIPRPLVLEPRSGTFTITAGTPIVVSRADSAVAHTEARKLSRLLEPAMGFALRVQVGEAAPSTPHILFERQGAADTLGLEGYVLDASPAQVRIRALASAGFFYGVQSLRQLLPPAIYREAAVAQVAWRVRAVHIEDAPRFSWRGAHLDVSRHFMPADFVKRFIDLLAVHKMNSFHWHLTDDQGWRFPVAKYPRLTEVGGCRAQSMIGAYVTTPANQTFDGMRHCGAYTADDIREVVAYAAERHITVVPEIEMPGHAQAAVSAYPALGALPDTQVAPRQIWGVSDVILNPEASTIQFMQDVLDEVMSLFPGPFVHIGGDEAHKAQWEASARVQSRMRELGVKDTQELQSWFIRQMDEYLTSHGRRLVGWDEILDGGLAPNATVMSWRGTAGGIAAAQAGHDVVMAPTSHTYFDYYQSRNTAAEPRAFGGFLPLDTVYMFEPVPTELTAAEATHVLGAQAQHWTEYMITPRHVEYMAFPRLSAMSEVVWTSRARKDLADFHARLRTHVERLAALGVNARPLDDIAR